MSKTFINEIRSHLEYINDLQSEYSIIKTQTLNKIIVENTTITIILNISKPKHLYKNIIENIKKTLEKHYKKFQLNILLTSENKETTINNINQNENINPRDIKHVIAIASGKGGVGKSTITTNIALSLAKLKYKIAILDADIYGPSQPKMLGLENNKPTQNSEGKINTLENYGIKCMSIGFLIEATKPMIWRGPMIQSALQQLIKDVHWGKLDFLLVDMPPGTGDVQLTMTQKVNLSGAIIISTPQDIALQDAIKGLNMFKKVNVPIIGLIENMSYHICPKCNEKTMLFGSGGAEITAKNFNIPFLGQIPLDIDIRENSDKGTPHKNTVNQEFDNISKSILSFISDK
tara:strand:+ start:36367 stop:37407 length:1041 start_codon:yes stop_codon:yes gene_type:complete